MRVATWVSFGTASCDLPGRSGGGDASTSTCTASSPWPTTSGSEAPLMTFDEVLALLRLSKNTLSRLASSGQIPGARKIGRAWRFRRDLLVEWLACSAPRIHTRRQGR